MLIFYITSLDCFFRFCKVNKSLKLRLSEPQASGRFFDTLMTNSEVFHFIPYYTDPQIIRMNYFVVNKN